MKKLDKFIAKHLDTISVVLIVLMLMLSFGLGRVSVDHRNELRIEAEEQAIQEAKLMHAYLDMVYDRLERIEDDLYGE